MKKSQLGEVVTFPTSFSWIQTQGCLFPNLFLITTAKCLKFYADQFLLLIWSLGMIKVGQEQPNGSIKRRAVSAAQSLFKYC